MNMNKRMQRKLIRAHIAEAKLRNAKIYNLGWWMDDGAIASITAKGELQSRLLAGQVTHEWI